MKLVCFALYTLVADWKIDNASKLWLCRMFASDLAYHNCILQLWHAPALQASRCAAQAAVNKLAIIGHKVLARGFETSIHATQPAVCMWQCRQLTCTCAAARRGSE